MPTLKELETILSANDSYELNEFHIKLKRCALAGHNFKTSMRIIYAADVSRCDVDSIMSAMRVSANRIEKP